MSGLQTKEKGESKVKQVVEIPTKPAGMVDVTLITYHEAEPKVLSVPKGTKIVDVLAQAGMAKQDNWEVHVDKKLASFDSVVDQSCEILYGLRLTGGSGR